MFSPVQLPSFGKDIGALLKTTVFYFICFSKNLIYLKSLPERKVDSEDKDYFKWNKKVLNKPMDIDQLSLQPLVVKKSWYGALFGANTALSKMQQ